MIRLEIVDHYVLHFKPPEACLWILLVILLVMYYSNLVLKPWMYELFMFEEQTACRFLFIDIPTVKKHVLMDNCYHLLVSASAKMLNGF